MKNKYLYYKQKYLEYKTKHKRAQDDEDNKEDAQIPKKMSISSLADIKINLSPLSLLDKIKKTFLYSELVQSINIKQAEQMVPLKDTSAIEDNSTLDRPKRNVKPPPYYPGMIAFPPTPKIFSPKTLKYLQSDLDNDIKEIEDIEDQYNLIDAEYKNFESNYGKIVEVWFADTQKCPCCNKSNSLRRYHLDNFPIIDLVCINPEHDVFNHGVRFFQVKASNGNTFRGSQYFNTTNLPGYIHTGSRKGGELIHKITASSSTKNKHFQIGYICIKIKPIVFENDSTIKIEQIDMILPILSKNESEYYSYTHVTHPIITWNSNNCQLITLRPRPTLEIDLNYLSTHFYEIIPNPLSKIYDFYNFVDN